MVASTFFHRNEKKCTTPTWKRRKKLKRVTYFSPEGAGNIIGPCLASRLSSGMARRERYRGRRGPNKTSPPLSRWTPGCRAWQDPRRRTEIIAVKNSHTRIKPLALASGHGPYVTAETERTIPSVGELPLYITVINL